MPLNDRQFQYFHGTASEVETFDTLLPSAKTGQSNHDYSDDGSFDDGRVRRNRVFMHLARPLGDDDDVAYERHHAESESWHWAGGMGRTRVMQVEPVGKVEGDHIGDVMAPKAKVLDTIWTPPIGHATGERLEPGQGHVQGTLPPFNWAHTAVQSDHPRHVEIRQKYGWAIPAQKGEYNWSVVDYAAERQAAKEQLTKERTAATKARRAPAPKEQGRLFDMPKKGRRRPEPFFDKVSKR